MRVGITCRIIETLEYEEIRDAVSHDLISFCNTQKAHPILIPNNLAFLSKSQVSAAKPITSLGLIEL